MSEQPDTLCEIPVAHLAADDIGSRLVAIDESGNAYAGRLTNLHATDWKYGKTPAEKVRITVTLEASEGSELKLSSLPLDFRVQIQRANVEPTS